MDKVVKDLKEFHEVYGVYTQEYCGFPDEQTRKLRRKLVREEMNEFFDAEDDNDIVEVADAIVDSIYVLVGTAISYGIPLETLWDEVQRSNMSKLGEDGKPIYRESDNKVLKGPNFFRPDIEGIISNHNSEVDYKMSMRNEED